jgi:hypothetical protein
MAEYSYRRSFHFAYICENHFLVENFILKDYILDFKGLYFGRAAAPAGRRHRASGTDSEFSPQCFVSPLPSPLLSIRARPGGDGARCGGVLGPPLAPPVLDSITSHHGMVMPRRIPEPKAVRSRASEREPERRGSRTPAHLTIR